MFTRLSTAFSDGEIISIHTNNYSLFHPTFAAPPPHIFVYNFRKNYAACKMRINPFHPTKLGIINLAKCSCDNISISDLICNNHANKRLALLCSHVLNTG